MNIIKIIGHPVLVMSIYLLLLISGESFGGFYAFYLLIGLPHGVADSIVSTCGMITMFIGYKIYRRNFNPIKPFLYILGNGIMIYGLFMFFKSSKGYNNATFHQTAPLISFGLFGLCILCNIVYAISLLLTQPKDSQPHPLNIVS